jgi:heme exporter protein D
MHWGSAGEFLAMGGYGFYVWSAYGVTALLLVAEVWQLISRRKAFLRHRADDPQRDRT